MSQTFYLRVEGQNARAPHAAEVKPLPDGQFQVTVDGTAYRVLLLNQSSHALSFQLNGDNVTVESHLQKGVMALSSAKGSIALRVTDERAERMRAASVDASADGKQEVLSPMPGKVVKHLVQVGDTVTQGQGVVVVEAMKMENELKSPKAGKVMALLAAEGAVVETGSPLAIIE